MKRTGIIGYANHSGLGNMTNDLINQLGIQSHLIIPGEDKGTDVSLSNAKNKLVASRWKPFDDEIHSFLDNIEVLFMIETSYHPNLIEMCKARGIKTVFLPMWEWFEWEKYKGADVYVCVSLKTHSYLLETLPDQMFQEYKNKIKYIPWPLDMDKFIYQRRGIAPNINFIHNGGFGGLNWRKGTLEVVEAFLKVVDPTARLYIRSQRPKEDYPCFDLTKNDRRIYFETQNFKTNSEMYKFGDIFLYPARYDGHALVVQEAMACGFPVFYTDAEPMNEFGDNSFFKIPVKEKVKIRIHNHDVDMNIADANVLSERMEQAIEMDLVFESLNNRSLIEEEYSWAVLKSKYLDLIKS